MNDIETENIIRAAVSSMATAKEAVVTAARVAENAANTAATAAAKAAETASIAAQTSAQTSISLARIEQSMEDFHKTTNMRCERHATALRELDINLNGDKSQEGINEQLRNFAKRHAIISALVPSGIIIAWEVFKHYLTGHW